MERSSYRSSIIGIGMVTVGSLMILWSCLVHVERMRKWKKRIQGVDIALNLTMWWNYPETYGFGLDGRKSFSDWLGDSGQQKANLYFKHLNPKHPSFSALAPLGYYHRPACTPEFIEFMHAPESVISHTINISKLFHMYQSNHHQRPQLIKTILLTSTKLPSEVIETIILLYSQEPDHVDPSCQLCLNPFSALVN